MNNANENIFQKIIRYLKQNGLKKTLKKIYRKIRRIDYISIDDTTADYMAYGHWRKKVIPNESQLQEQRIEEFEPADKISLIVPLYQTKKEYLQELIECILAQTYANWELCLADGSPRDTIKAIVDTYADKRIRYRFIGKNQGIAGNTNEALKMATGKWIALLDHDDVITPDALYEVMKAVSKDSQIGIVYSDEDKINSSGKEFYDPSFKPDFNLDMLRSVNYICHLFVVRSDVLEQIGGDLRSEYDGAQDYDLILRCVEWCMENEHQIYHIPKVLYHWRIHQNSTAGNPESKTYAYEAGRKAISAHLKRLNIEGEVLHGPTFGLYHVKYGMVTKPLVSIIIPNKDHIEDLKICIESIREAAGYEPFEFVIVENNSVEEETFTYYEELKKLSDVNIVTYEGPFNFSAIINCGAKHAKGEFFLLLNNDTRMIGEDGLKEMASYLNRPEVGAVGAKLLYADDTIQHAGVVIGFGGIAGHTFIGLHKDEYTYNNRAIIDQDYSAVTGACLMTKKSVFESVNGFDEELAVAFNDIDYCMKVRQAGYLIVYNPYVVLYHYESKSRGYEDTPQKVERFNREIDTFARKWPDILKDGDPYYNKNLTLNKSNFALRNFDEEPVS